MNTKVVVDCIAGVGVGVLLSAINFKSLKNQVNKAVGIDPKKITGYFFKGYLIRYVVSGVILCLALFYKGLIFFIGVCVGLLVLKAGVYYEHFFKQKLNTKEC